MFEIERSHVNVHTPDLHLSPKTSNFIGCPFNIFSSHFLLKKMFQLLKCQLLQEFWKNVKIFNLKFLCQILTLLARKSHIFQVTRSNDQYLVFLFPKKGNWVLKGGVNTILCNPNSDGFFWQLASQGKSCDV